MLLLLQRTLGDVWRHFWLSQLGGCHWHLEGGGLYSLQGTRWLPTEKMICLRRLRTQDHILFLFYSVNELNYNDRFSNIKPTLHSWNKSNLVVMLSFLYITEFDLLIFCLEFRHLYIHKTNWLVIFLSL